MLVNNELRSIEKVPLSTPGSTSNDTLPSPTVLPLSNATPEDGMSNRSPAINGDPLPPDPIAGPNNESPPKMYGVDVAVVTPVNVMPGIMVSIPNVKDSITAVGAGPLLVNNTSNKFPVDPALTVTDWIDIIKSARAGIEANEQTANTAVEST